MVLFLRRVWLWRRATGTKARLLSRTSASIFAVLLYQAGAFEFAAADTSERGVNVEVFVASRCRDCNDLERLLESRGISYTRYDLEADPKAEADYLQNLGHGILPAVRVGAEVVRGYNPDRILKLAGRQSPKSGSATISDPTFNVKTFVPGESMRLERGQATTDSGNVSATLQLLSEGATMYAGLEGLEVRANTATQEWKKETDDQGIVVFDSLPCVEPITFISSGFASLTPQDTWGIQGSLECSRPRNDLGAYSSMTGKRAFDAVVMNMTGAKEAARMGREFAQQVLQRVAERKAAAAAGSAAQQSRPVSTTTPTTTTPKTVYDQRNEVPDEKTIILVGAIILLLLYITPTIVAFTRGHPNRWLIAGLNGFLGATGIVWFGCLIWAFNRVHDPRNPDGSKGGESGLNLFANDVKKVELVNPPGGSTAAELERLAKLLDAGVVTQSEFEQIKRKYLTGG